MSEKILVVDDDPSIQRLCSRMLERMDLECVYVSSVAEAQIQSLDQFAAAMLDMQLPDGSGTELSRWIYGQRPELPILIFSGRNQSAVTFAVPEQKVSFMPKPFKRSELADKLRELGVSIA